MSTIDALIHTSAMLKWDPRKRYGSDPRIATCRGKLQNKRSKLNQEINKELRLRAGAENLFRATTNRKLKETVALELSFVNSNLQLLKEQLAELNSSVEIYQGDSLEPVMPMIPLGLKETKDVDFKESFKDFILEHYSEDGSKYEGPIKEFCDMRQAMRTPHRDPSGIALLFQYYNQLYFVERRFFPPNRSLGIYFEWYDSLTGVPSCQRTVAFEKACVLFNIAAVYTQMGAKQDRSSSKGLDSAVEAFLRSAGALTYLQDNFTNAPTMDLGPSMLAMLTQLMLAQARECLFEKLELQSKDKRDVDMYFDLAQEAAQVVKSYRDVYALMSSHEIADYLPYSWLSMSQVKIEHYSGLFHLRTAQGVLEQSQVLKQNSRASGLLQMAMKQCDSLLDYNQKQQYSILSTAHARAAILKADEAARLQRMCRELKHKSALIQVLEISIRRTNTVYNTTSDSDLANDQVSDLIEAPCLQGTSKFELRLTQPDFGQLKVDDLFRSLGPIAVFNAKHEWSAPRSVQLHQTLGDSVESGFGFSISTDSPVIVTSVLPNSLAHYGGMKEGDFIVAVGDKDVKWSSHEEVVKLIRDSKDTLTLKIVTPMNKNYLKAVTGVKNNRKGRESQASTSSSGSKGSSNPPSTSPVSKKLTWNPFKKQREKENLNVILR